MHAMQWHPGRVAEYEVGVYQGVPRSQYRRHSVESSRTKAYLGQVVPECSALGVPWKVMWSQRSTGPKCFRVICIYVTWVRLLEL